MISVLINNYNYAQYISEALESVLKQTYQNYEIIVVDDGSTDGSIKIIEAYASKYPDKIRKVLKENGGQASAFNAGVTESQGDILAFLDSDDYWMEEKLARIAEAHGRGEFVSHNKYHSKGTPDREDPTLNQKRRQLLLEYGQAFNLTTSTLSISRRLAETIFPMPEAAYGICADNYLALYALYLAEIVFLEQELSFYRIHGENRHACNPRSRSVADYTHMSVRLINAELSRKGAPPIPICDTASIRRMHQKEEGIVICPKPYVVYGTGAYAAGVGRYLLDCRAKIVYYCDSDPQKWGRKIDGVQTISPKELPARRGEYHQIFIASSWAQEISCDLIKLGLTPGKDFIFSKIKSF